MLKLKPFTSLALVLLLARPLSTLSAQAIVPPGTAESTIRSLEEQERLAVLNEDMAALERLWSGELMVNNPQNAVSPDRATVLDSVRRGLIRYARFERRIEAIRFHDDVAVVMGSETIVRRNDPAGPAPAVDRRFTNVWQQIGTTWNLIARHASVIAGN